LQPSGKHVITELHLAGGIPQVMKILLVHGQLHGDATTISGETVAETLKTVPSEPRSDQDVIRPWDHPIAPEGHLVILRGNLATEGAVAKISKTPKITGPARVFESEEKCLAAILANTIRAGDVIVIRYEGPKGGPGMREMLAPTSALIGAGLGDSVGLITDGRFSGATHGLRWYARAIPSPSIPRHAALNCTFRRRRWSAGMRSGSRPRRVTRRVSWPNTLAWFRAAAWAPSPT
jgi:dihydroxy-acid dehydratase